MASTGNVFPGTGENLDRSGASDWVNPGNIVSDNTTDATCASGASGCDYLIARNFNFASVPTNATIAGVTVRVEASEHSTGTEPLNAQLQDASAALIGASKQQTISGTGKAVYTYGGTADLWSGANPTPAMVHDADFGVRLWFTTTHDIRIDYVTVALEYTVPTAGRSDETDTALAVATVKIETVGLASETDTAFALEFAGPQEIPTGLAAETDTGLANALVKIETVGPADESDTALALAATKQKAPGRSDETDAALSLARVKIETTGRADETDTGIARALVKQVAAGRSNEGDSALAPSLGGAIQIPVGLAQETDSAQALTIHQGPAEEFLTGGAPVRRFRRALKRPARAPVLVAVGAAEEKDSAQPLKLRQPSRAAALAISKRVPVQAAGATESAGAASVQRRIDVRLATETQLVLPLDVVRLVAVAVANERAHGIAARPWVKLIEAPEAPDEGSSADAMQLLVLDDEEVLVACL